MKKIILLLASLAMILNGYAQDKKISQLSTASSPIGDSTLYVVVQSSTTKKQYFVDLQKNIWYAGNSTSTAIGTEALNSNTASYNTGIGSRSLYSNNGAYNTAVGHGSIEDNSSGTYLTAIGMNALANNTTGDKNTAVGASALVYVTTGSNNTAVGYRAGYTNSTSGCVYIGYEAGYNNSISNTLFIDNSNTATPLIWGNFATDSLIINGDFRVTGYSGGANAWTNESDSTLKKNIITIDGALEKVLKLRGVEFEWKDNRQPGKQIGFVAQEVKRVIPELVSGSEGSLSIQTSQVTALLVEAVKDQQRDIKELQFLCGILLFLILSLTGYIIIRK